MPRAGASSSTWANRPLRRRLEARTLPVVPEDLVFVPLGPAGAGPATWAPDIFVSAARCSAVIWATHAAHTATVELTMACPVLTSTGATILPH